MNLRYLKYTILSVAALLWCACSKDDEPKSNVPANSCYDFVTFVSNGENGSTFELQVGEDTPVITYTSRLKFATDSTLNVNDRMIIAYTRIDGQPYTSGPINLYGYRILDNTCQSVINELPDSIASYDIDAITVQSVTRTGHYINIQSQLSCTQARRPLVLALVRDSLSVADECPALHLVYKAKDPGLNSFSSYASFDIDSIWSDESCTGVLIYAYNGKSQSTFRFNK